MKKFHAIFFLFFAWFTICYGQKPVWNFSVKVGIEGLTANNHGGFTACKNLVLNQFDSINKEFQGFPFNGVLMFHVTGVYLYSGDLIDEMLENEDHNEDLLVLYDEVRNERSGYYDTYRTVCFTDGASRLGGTFGTYSTAVLIHEIGHFRGAVDMYAMEVKSYNNPINGDSYFALEGIMNKTLRPIVWDQHSCHMINYHNNRVYNNNTIADQFPFAWLVYMANNEGDSVPDCRVNLYRVQWGDNNVVPGYPDKSVYSDSKGVVTFFADNWLYPNPFDAGDYPFFNIKYPTILLEADFGSAKGYGWMNAIDVQVFGFQSHMSDEPFLTISPNSSDSGSTGDDPPVPPSNLTAVTPVGLVSYVDLHWSDNSNNEDRFVIHRQREGGDWEYIGQVGRNCTGFTDKEAYPFGNSTHYCYRVRSVKAGPIRSSWSNSACVTMYSAAPDAPVLDTNGISGCINTLYPQFNWTSVNRAEDYWIVAIQKQRTLTAIDATTTGTSYHYQGNALLGGDEYYVKVKAVNNAGGAWSNIVYFTPYCDGRPKLYTPGPDDCISSLRPDFVWSNVPGATMYQLAVGTDDPENYYIYPHVYDTVYTPADDLIADTLYRFKVKGISGQGDGTWSNINYFTPGCTKELNVSAYAVYLDHESGSTGYFIIDANTNWSINSTASWIDVFPVSGSGKDTVIIKTMGTNPSAYYQTTKITVSSDGIPDQEIDVVQFGSDPYIVLSDEILVLGSQIGNTDTLLIGSNTSWTVSKQADWFTISADTGKDQGIIIVTSLADNTSQEPLIDTLTVSLSEEYNIKVLVKQMGTNPVLNKLEDLKNIDEDIKIVPNPASKFIIVTGGHRYTGIEIYDVQGRMVNKSNRQESSVYDISFLPEGVYIVSFSYADKRVVRKLVINH